MFTQSPTESNLARDHAIELRCAIATTLDGIYETLPAERAAVTMPEIDDMEGQLNGLTHPLDQMTADEWTEVLVNRGLVVLP